MNLTFAYGSNMRSAQMVGRCPRHQVVSIGCLRGYRLAFTRWSPKRQSQVADVIPSPGAEVWGVVYRLDDDDLHSLDLSEGHPTSYAREALEILLQDGTSERCWVYIVVTKEPEQPPAHAYWKAIVEGAREHQLPSPYQERLAALDHRP